MGFWGLASIIYYMNNLLCKWLFAGDVMASWYWHIKSYTYTVNSRICTYVYLISSWICRLGYQELTDFLLWSNHRMQNIIGSILPARTVSAPCWLLPTPSSLDLSCLCSKSTNPNETCERTATHKKQRKHCKYGFSVQKDFAKSASIRPI